MPDLEPWLMLAIAVVAALVVALFVTIVISLIARAASRRHDWAKALVSSARHPFRLLLAVIAVGIAVASNPLPDDSWRSGTRHTFYIVVIALTAWLIGAIVSFALQRAMIRYRTDVRDNRIARRMQTQLAIVRRLSMAIIALIGIATILLTFDGVRAIGTSLLASAGVASIVAGLAAQSTLANVFAGVQLAFSDAIRVDDVVVVEAEWGKIEEITLTYVVVHLWDDRRMVMPSTYFTSTPFQNWTRTSSELLGSVDFDLDWRVSPSEMRAKLEEILANTALWDTRASVLQVTDAVGGFVHIRILVTAVDAPTLFDLRCLVREQMVEWLRTEAESLPTTRVQMVEEGVVRRKASTAQTDQIGLFTGSPEAEKRANNFTVAIPVQDSSGREHPRDD